MLSSALKISEAGFNFLTHEDLIHQVVPTCGFWQFPHQSGGFLFDGTAAFFGCRHGFKKPQEAVKCKTSLKGMAGSGVGLGEEIDEQGEYFVAVLAGEAEGELGGEQAVVEIDVMAAALDFVGEIAFAAGGLGEGA